VKLDKVPANRLARLARVGLGSKAPILERTPEPRRTALLTSVVWHLQASAIDDALDLFSVLMQVKLISGGPGLGGGPGPGGQGVKDAGGGVPVVE
jgi:hypothetical protein